MSPSHFKSCIWGNTPGEHGPVLYLREFVLQSDCGHLSWLTRALPPLEGRILNSPRDWPNARPLPPPPSYPLPQMFCRKKFFWSFLLDLSINLASFKPPRDECPSLNSHSLGWGMFHCSITKLEWIYLPAHEAMEGQTAGPNCLRFQPSPSHITQTSFVHHPLCSLHHARYPIPCESGENASSLPTFPNSAPSFHPCPPPPCSPPPRFSSDEISSQREYFGPVLCSQTNSPGSFNLVSINIITVCSVISTLPWFVHVIHALASTPPAVLYTHTQMPICVYILHVMYGYRVLKEGYAFHHACNFFSSSSKSVS